MARSPETEARLRAALEGHEGISEKPMMGAVCFFLDGNMVGCADLGDGDGRFMFRVGKAAQDDALAQPGAEPAILGGRRMGGLIFVAAEACDDAALRDWTARALDFARTLPPK